LNNKSAGIILKSDFAIDKSASIKHKRAGMIDKSTVIILKNDFVIEKNATITSNEPNLSIKVRVS